MEIAQNLGYKPNLLARSMRTERTHTLGIIADDLLSPFTPPIIRGIQDYLKTVDYLGLIVNADLDPATEADAINTLLSRAVEGIIFVESFHRAPTEELERSQKPYTFVHRLFGEPIKNSVVPDDFAGAVLAVEHLIALGHRCIAHIAGPRTWHSARRRVEGYVATLAAHDLPCDDTLLAEGDWEFEGGVAAMQSLLRRSPLPTAIFVANDVMAVGALDVLRNAGLRVPEEIALVSYDNLGFCRLFRPKLTTVSLPAYQMGQQAAALLCQKLQGDRADLDEVRICGRLYVRESCGAPVAMRTEDELNVGTTVRHLLIGKQPENH
jgi:LacI family transcriptional regulator